MISAILLAAGESKRMNGENKLTKKINGKPLIKHSVKNVIESSVEELIIVIGHKSNDIKNLISKNGKIKFILNKNYKSGMSSSIKVGLNNLSEKTQSFFICLADMPMVSKEIYNQLIKFSKNKEIIVPNYKKQQGNPVLFSISMKDEIMSIEGDNGAKKILDKNKDKILNLEINDEGILKNYNRPNNFDC
tara:strand:- start:185 stop:754 length:570 start_codon:yes stop_codon:yes gene_type:complete